ncbi:MAG: DNA polymerase III subunit beta [Thiomonas arsenitoxydans]|uniref:Beta sliding clamp n=2 Tax=Thiomonas TaxID=32012 RepID=A0A8I1N019_THIA3|nr:MULTISPECIES: DNA polymerase III subunit beta [Thiomonas]MBN8745429.1 DNA polymerase III subunit beta [Thiomonas arsenitoxydans]ODU95781.1 MAG: DNA polymerase III subunit beta [Thiomonas sp. SCN 64-16]
MNRLTSSRDELLKLLGQGAGIVERRQTLPILANVLIQHNANGTLFITSDMEVQIRLQAGEAVQTSAEDAAITVNMRKLLDILRAASPGNVTLEWSDGKMTVRAAKSRFSLQTLPAEDFPLVRAATDFSDHALRLPQKLLKRLLGLTHFAMAQHDIRYYLNGMLWVADGQQMHLVATDGHRMTLASAPLEKAVERREIILPRKTVLELSRLLSDEDDAMIDIALASNQARLTLDGLEFTSKLIEGKFPDYQRVVPKGHRNMLQVERTTLQAALQRVAILTNDKFKGVRVNLEPGLLRLTSINAEQEEAQEEIDIDYGGDVIEIGFNIAYLIDALANMTSDQIRLELQDGNSSALFTMPDEPNFKYVVMPMRI